MKDVELYAKVRHAVRIEGLSERAAARRFGIDARTVNKMMRFSVPPGYVRKKPPAKPKLDPFIAIIDGILADDKSRPKKQQHTSKRIFERLRDEHGFTGGITIVKDYVAGWRQRAAEMFVPLVHPPGHAQADFGEAIGVIGGVERKLHFFAFDLPHSDAGFVVAYPAETTEAFCDGHVAAFSFFGGVPKSILYDNTKIAVARILGDGKRQRTRVFSELQSHYLFEDRFGRPGKGNDTRARSKGLLVTHGGTSWCRSRCSRASRRSTPTLWTAAESAWVIACAVTARRSASGLRATLPPSRHRCLRPTMHARRFPRASRHCRWCATGSTTTRCQRPTVTTMCLYAVTCMRWLSLVARR